MSLLGSWYYCYFAYLSFPPKSKHLICSDMQDVQTSKVALNLNILDNVEWDEGHIKLLTLDRKSLAPVAWEVLWVHTPPCAPPRWCCTLLFCFKVVQMFHFPDMPGSIFDLPTLYPVSNKLGLQIFYVNKTQYLKIILIHRNLDSLCPFETKKLLGEKKISGGQNICEYQSLNQTLCK